MPNIQMNIQTSNAAAPPVGEYGDMWIGKNGSLFTADENGNAIAAVPTLAHSYTAPTHTLTGTMPQSGIVSAIFKPTASYNDGESISVNGTAYTLAKGSFEQDIPVQALFDIGAKTVTVGGSGGGGKMGYQVSLVNGRRSYGVASEWVTENVPSGTNGFDYKTVILGDKTYSTIGSFRIIERNLTTNAFKFYDITGVTNFSPSILDIHNNELYMLGTAGTAFTIYKVNLATLTLSLYFSGFNVGLGTNPHIVHTTHSKILIGGRLVAGDNEIGYYGFDYITKTFERKISTVGNSIATSVNGTGVSQKLNNGDILVGMMGHAVSSKIFIQIWKYFSLSGQMSEYGKIDIPYGGDFMQSQQIAEKLIWLSRNSYNSSRIGELDLLNKTITYTGFPQPPISSTHIFNSFIYQNQLTMYSADKKHTLNLLQSPPYLNPTAIEIAKGQWYSTPYDSVTIDAIPELSQPQIVIDGTKKQATMDLDIKIGSYDLISSILVNLRS